MVVADSHRQAVKACPAVPAVGHGRTFPRSDVPAPPGRAEHDVHVDRFGEDDWADRVVEIEVLGADEGGDVARQRRRRQWTGRDDQRIHRRIRWYPIDLFAREGDAGVMRDRVGDRLRKALTIDGERGAGGHAARFSGTHDDRAEAPHLLFEEAHRVIELVPAQRIGADQLRQPIRLVHERRPHRPHFVEDDVDARLGRLPGSF